MYQKHTISFIIVISTINKYKDKDILLLREDKENGKFMENVLLYINRHGKIMKCLDNLSDVSIRDRITTVSTIRCYGLE